MRTLLLSSVAFVIGGVLPQTGGSRARGEDPAAGAEYVLVPTAAKRIKAELTLEVKAPKVQADEWCVYFAQLPALPGQVDVRTTLLPRGKTARELSEAKRPMVYARVPATGPRRHEFTARITYEATLLERRLERREGGSGAPEPPAVAPLDPKTRRLELAGGPPFDHESAGMRAWLDAQKLHREPAEDEVDFARRAFLAVRKGIAHFEGAGVEHLASRVCAAGKSDYAGITAVYVAALRANGIPTRALCGRVVIYEGEPTQVSWVHAKAEFFAQGIGWVPADVAGAIRINRSPEGLEFFGNDSAEFLTMHLDTDLVIETYTGRKTLDWLPESAVYVLGGGSFEGGQTRASVTVTVAPVELAEALARKTPGPGAVAKKPAAKAKPSRPAP